MDMTMKQAAQLAMDVQDACNLSGVVYLFSNILSDVLWPEARRIGLGTEWVNTHPIATLFIFKLMDMNRLDYESGFSKAWDACEALVNSVEVQP